MVLASTLFCLLHSLTLVSGHLLSDDQKRTMKMNPEAGRKAQSSRQDRSVSSQEDKECQEGIPLGVSYSGKMNVTTSGETCQVWASDDPHGHSYTYMGEHNHCRNPDGDPRGVWCYTTDPDQVWELCYVPRCEATYNCQEGNPPGISYSGTINVTVSGRKC